MLTRSNRLPITTDSTLLPFSNTEEQNATYFTSQLNNLNLKKLNLPPSPPLIATNTTNTTTSINFEGENNFNNGKEIILNDSDDSTITTTTSSLDLSNELLLSPLFGSIYTTTTQPRLKPIIRPELSETFLLDNQSHQDSTTTFDITTFTEQNHSIVDELTYSSHLPSSATSSSFSSTSLSNLPLDTTYYLPREDNNNSIYFNQDQQDSPTSSGCPELELESELSPFIDPAEFINNITPSFSPNNFFLTTDNNQSNRIIEGDYLPLFPGLKLSETIDEVSDEMDDVEDREEEREEEVEEELNIKLEEDEEDDDDYEEETKPNKKRPRRSSSTSTSNSNITTATTSKGRRGSNGKRIFNGTRSEELLNTLPLDSPIQKRNYKSTSRTSRKPIPVAIARAMKLKPLTTTEELNFNSNSNFNVNEIEGKEKLEEVLAEVEIKRTINTLAARKSRERKAQYLKDLEGEVVDQREEILELKAEVERLKKLLG